MVECLSEAPELLAGLDQAGRGLRPGTKGMVVGAHNDIGLYRELMRRGRQRSTWSHRCSRLQLIRTISGLYADPATPFVGRSLAFVGAKGGVGASTSPTTSPTCWPRALHVANTAMVDFDLAFGTAGLDFNQDPLQGVADALSKPDRLDQVLLDRIAVPLHRPPEPVRRPGRPGRRRRASPTRPSRRSPPRSARPRPSWYFDLPHLWSGWMKKTLLAADEVVIVAAPDLGLPAQRQEHDRPAAEGPSQRRAAQAHPEPGRPAGTARRSR